MKKAIFLNLFIGLGLIQFSSCEKEQIRETVDKNSRSSIELRTVDLTEEETYLISEDFKSELESFGTENFPNYMVQYSPSLDEIRFIEDEEPLPSGTKWIVRIFLCDGDWGGLPDGMYFLNLCNGELQDSLGVVRYPGDPDADPDCREE